MRGESEAAQLRSGTAVIFHATRMSHENLFGGWIRCRDTVVDVHERRSNEPCSGATGRV